MDILSLLPQVALAIALIVVLAGGTAAILWARRYYQGDQDDPASAPSLEDYRKLLDDGQIDPAEFERIRARLRDEPPPSTDIREGPPPTTPSP